MDTPCRLTIKACHRKKGARVRAKLQSNTAALSLATRKIDGFGSILPLEASTGFTSSHSTHHKSSIGREVGIVVLIPDSPAAYHSTSHCLVTGVTTQESTKTAFLSASVAGIFVVVKPPVAPTFGGQFFVRFEGI